MANSSVYLIYIIDPTVELPGVTGAYTYQSIEKLSRQYLVAAAKKSYDTSNTNPNISANEQAMLAGSLAPPDDPDGGVYTPAIPDSTTATNYLNSISYPPVNGIATWVASPNHQYGVQVEVSPGVFEDCVGIYLNTSNPATPAHVFLVNEDPTHSRNALRGVLAFDPSGTSNLVGEQFEVFLVKVSDLTFTPTGQSVSYAQANAQQRFKFQPVGAGYFWRYSNTSTITSLDVPGTSANIQRALKPTAASDGTYTFQVNIENPDSSVPEQGLEVRARNLTQGGSFSSYTLFSAGGSANITLTGSPHAVAEDDVLEFEIRVLGDNSQTPAFTVVQPAAQVVAAHQLRVNQDNIVSEDLVVTLRLTNIFILIIEDVIVRGKVYQNDETTPVPLGILDANLSFIGGPVQTASEPIVSYSGAAGFTHTFAGVNAGLGDAARIKIDQSSTFLDFYPRRGGGGTGLGLDSDHTQEDLVITFAMVSNIGGNITATVDYDASPLNSLALKDPIIIVSCTNNFEISGSIVNNCSGGAGVINDGDLVVNISIPARSYTANNVAVLGSGENFGPINTGATQVCEGDTIIIEIRSPTEGNRLVKISDTQNTIGTVPAPPNNTSLTITVTAGMISSGELVLDAGDEITLGECFGPITSVTKFTFSGFVFHECPPDPPGVPIPAGATMFIKNVTKGFSKVCPISTSGDGHYEVLFEDTDLATSGTLVASVGDTIHYIVFADVGSPIVEENYPDPGSDLIQRIQGDQAIPSGGGVPPGTFAFVTTLTLGDIQAHLSEVPPRGERVQNHDLQGCFVPPTAEEVIVVSKPIEAGTKVPIRALPFIDIELPQNVTGGVPFELQMWLSNNANDAVPRFDEVTTFPDLGDSGAGRLSIPGSTNPLRLHIFSDTAKTASTYAIALKVRMKRNDATGTFKMHSYGVRWWNRD